MSCYQLITTITISHNSLNSKQSLETKPPQFQSQSLELVTIVIAINVVIGGFSGLDDLMVGSCNCPITTSSLQIS